MPEANSPLRYPGGKAVLSDFLASVIETNDITDCVYVEPFAGGAGAAINLLLAGNVERIILNDADRNIWALWKAILDHSDEFISRVETTALTTKEWLRQKTIYETPKGRTTLERGFAAFFLNRCNRSGIITNGGIIGGLEQKGKWKIDARFNRKELRRRIERIAAYRDKITLANLDAIAFMRRHVLTEKDRSKFFIYLDPPYFVKGSGLYLNYYNKEDHADLATFLRRLKGLRWLVTYDDVQEIRKIYKWCKTVGFSLRYSAHSARKGGEIVLCDKTLKLSEELLFNAVA